MSGLLTEDDGGKTDLGTLEKRLAEKSSLKGTGSGSNSVKVKSPSLTSQSQHPTPQDDTNVSPGHSITSPNGSENHREKKRNEQVSELSDMMCSLVTNNCGETRYIGMY